MRQRSQFPQQVDSTDLGDARHGDQQLELLAKSFVCLDQLDGYATQLEDAFLHRLDGTAQISKHASRRRSSGLGSMQAVDVAHPIDVERFDIAAQGAQFKSFGAGPKPRSELHTLTVLGQGLRIRLVGLRPSYGLGEVM